jgi:hypothetical protein
VSQLNLYNEHSSDGKVVRECANAIIRHRPQSVR